ncbi:hypothetical protein SKAU_G00203090 [Synaphobranchus kaupii]|uniref:Uncharacterized protein n=1 Tax=Synaphobranchus kaupii TaxID=118154 RepID=A0A9Q1FG88_SYNKA|nr:hypothetical protein SKAU_G00203090 [Synaphobranchus kaupii]
MSWRAALARAGGTSGRSAIDGKLAFVAKGGQVATARIPRVVHASRGLFSSFLDREQQGPGRCFGLRPTVSVINHGLGTGTGGFTGGLQGGGGQDTHGGTGSGAYACVAAVAGWRGEAGCDLRAVARAAGGTGRRREADPFGCLSRTSLSGVAPGPGPEPM